MVRVPTKPISLQEFLDLPETKPASEYVDGLVYQKPMPQGKHSKLQTSLVSQINQWGEPENLAYAFTELRCTVGERSIIPDIVVFLWENLPLDEEGEICDRIKQAPDWAIEILSPNQSMTQPMDNLLFLLEQGMSLGWLINPYEKAVLVFQKDSSPLILRGSDTLPLPKVLNQNSLTAMDIFQFLKFTPQTN